jgi:HlyD family secretion protein
MKAKKAALIALVAVVVIGVGVLVTARANRKPVTEYDTVPVDRGNIVARVTATGTLSALVTVQVGSQVSGRIAQLLADFNSQVKKNDVIAKIDPELFKASVEQARANYVSAAGNLEKSKAQAVDSARQYERAKALAEKQLIAIADRDTAEAAAAVAKAQVSASEGDVAQARAALHLAETNLEYSTIKSPIDGVVISRSVDVGQTVASALQAPTLFTIAEDLKKMQVDTNVAEADVGKLQADMDATFTVDAYPQERFRGKVRQIRNAPITVQNVVTYDAVIDVDNPDLKLKPGMTANVSFTYARRDDVLRVPNSALRFRPPGELGRAASAAAAPASSAPQIASAAPEGSAHEGHVAAAGSSSAGSGWSGRVAHQGSPDRPRGQWRGPRGSREPTNDRTLWVLDGPDPHPVVVKVGISDGTMTEIAEGNLKPGDALVTDIAGDSTSPHPTATGNMPGGMRRLF